MRLPRQRPTTSISLILLLPILAIAVSLDCSDIRDDKTSWNLEELGGPHSLYTVNEHASKIRNTTFTFDICKPLVKTKGIPKDEDCPNHTWGNYTHWMEAFLAMYLTNLCFMSACAIERLTNTVENITTISDTIPIAGDYRLSGGGGDLNPKWKRLKSSDSPADREKEGVRLSIGGGKHDKKDQKAFIDFICIPKAEERRRELGNYLTTEEDEEVDRSGEEVDDEHGGKIKFRSWEDEGDAKALRLEWHTQYACEDAVEGNNKPSSGHWGFFTWFIIM